MSGTATRLLAMRTHRARPALPAAGRRPRRPSAAAVALLAVALAAAAPSLLAQPAAEGEPFLDRIDVNVANVEVVVRDRDGQPVPGLDKDDFEVLEDGVPVTVTNFFEVSDGREIYGGESASGADPAAPPAPAATSAGTRQLLLVVYLDLLHLDAASRNLTFDSLRDSLRENLGADDRVMLVTFDGKVNLVERFTADVATLEARLDELAKQLDRGHDVTMERRALLEALARAPLAPRPEPPRIDSSSFDLSRHEAERLLAAIRQLIVREVQRVDLSVEGLAQFSASLAGLRGRKAILYVSQGLPSRPGESVVRAWVDKYALWATANDVREIISATASAESLPRDLGDRFRALVRQANSHQVSLYALAPPPRGGSHGGLGADNRGTLTSSGITGESTAISTLDLFGREASLLEMTGGTGGVAFTRSFNADELLERVESDFSHFYSLGYTPPHPADDEYHRVEVRVRGRDDLEVRHVGGYRAIDPQEELRQVALSALRYDVDDNPLGMALQVGRHLATVGGQYRVPLTLAIPFSRLAILPSGGFYTGRVTAYIVVEDEEGKMSPFQRIELPIRIPEDRYALAAESVAGYQVDLTMRQGRHRVAVAVRDEIADLGSSLSFEVEVGRGES